MRLRVAEARAGLSTLLEADPRIRHRLLATAILLLLIVFLVYFNTRQGLPDTGSVNSRLILFVAININIVLLAVVFYMIAKNLLKLVVERHKQVLGVTLKTKLIAAFTLLSLPAMAFHLFASSFISTTLESWLTGQHESVVDNARQVSEVYHRDLKEMLALESWVLRQHAFDECLGKRSRKVFCQCWQPLTTVVAFQRYMRVSTHSVVVSLQVSNRGM